MTQKQFTNIVYGYTDIYGYDEANNHIAVTISNGIFYFYYENGLLMTFDLLLNNGKNVVIKSYTSGQLYSSRYLLRDNLGTICYMEDEYYEEDGSGTREIYSFDYTVGELILIREEVIE